MKFYLAPLEGITGFVYRNSYNKYFKGLDKYFMPFLNPKSYGYLSAREKEELAKENNQGIHVIPQILTNDAEDFLETAKRLHELGYHEVNFNLGCPSKPVVNKGRGAGFLANPEQLDEFLMEIFTKCEMDISIKTRIGKESADEFPKLLETFNKYPIKELIVHPRVGADYYGNRPNKEAFGEALASSRAPTCYNGDIFTQEDYKGLIGAFGQVEAVMLGRGLIRNPFLIEHMCQEETDNKESRRNVIVKDIVDAKRFWEFHDDVLNNYQRVIPISMEKTVIFKMKELWVYMIDNFANNKEWQNKINETNSIIDYKIVISDMKKEQFLNEN